MTSSKFPNLFKWHVLGFLVTLFFLLFLVFYQLIVDIYYQRLPLFEFLKPATFKKALAKIKYHSPDLGQPQNFPEPSRLTLDCQQFCQFVLKDLNKTIPALVDNNSQGRLEDLKLEFHDSQAELIGYQTKDSLDPSFFVIDYQPQLIQVIKLDLNHQKYLEFVNYYPQTRQILFKSHDNNQALYGYYLYSADSPSLSYYQKDPS